MCRTWASAAILLLSFLAACRANPEVTITQGALLGTYLTTNHGRTISGFLGIPYAQPPVGALRFSNPLPAESWSGTRNATVDSAACPQDIASLVTDEDCLYLNVYTPQLPNGTTTSLLPVMVWVHGGGFTQGSTDSTTLGPEYLLDKDIVHVAMNYRLGLLGFFSTGDSVAPGNFGLKDQALALQWVHDNIRSFGGDPDKVTLFGNSAGGASVHYLSLSDSTQGLFHRYILQSGCANAMWTYQERSTYAEDAFALGERFGCSSTSTAELVDCLRELNYTTIMTARSLENPLSILTKDDDAESFWGPTDEEEGTDGAFLTDSPQNLLAQGKIRDVPWIVGNTREEGLMMTGYFYLYPELFENILNNLESVIAGLGFDGNVEDTDAFTAAIISYYFSDRDGDRTELLKNYTDLIGDAMFVFPAVDLLDKHLAFATQPAYFYSFEYRGAMSYTFQFTGGSNIDIGVGHVDECIYLFPQSNSTFAALDEDMSERDMIMVDQMVELWTTFATNGVPTLSSLSNPNIWEPYALNKRHLQIGNNSDETLYLESALFEDRMQFWRELTSTSAANTLTPIFTQILLVTCLIVRAL